MSTSRPQFRPSREDTARRCVLALHRLARRCVLLDGEMAGRATLVLTADEADELRRLAEEADAAHGGTWISLGDAATRVVEQARGRMGR